MMRRFRIVASVTAVMLLSVAVANGASDAAVPKVTFTGTYSLTYRVTNAKNIKPSRWIYGATCASPCHRVSFHQRLASETSWRSTVLVYTWNGSGYALVPRTQRNFADCRSSSGKAVKKGYDATSTQTLRIIRVVDGRVVKLTGTGRDAYTPNALGRKAGCVMGTYVFAITGTAR